MTCHTQAAHHHRRKYRHDLLYSRHCFLKNPWALPNKMKVKSVTYLKITINWQTYIFACSCYTGIYHTHKYYTVNMTHIHIFLYSTNGWLVVVVVWFTFSPGGWMVIQFDYMIYVQRGWIKPRTVRLILRLFQYTEQEHTPFATFTNRL